MSYWVYLKDAESNTVEVPRHQEGGTYVVGGICNAELNITYNYAKVYGRFDFSIRDLDGKWAGDYIEVMEKIVAVTGTARGDDYWEPTPGNAGYALSILLAWAKLHPDAVFGVS